MGMGLATRNAASASSNMTANPRASPKRRAQRESHVIGNHPPAGKARSRSFFPEGPHELILQGLNQIRHHRAFPGLNEGLNRHSRDKFDIAKPPNLALRH